MASWDLDPGLVGFSSVITIASACLLKYSSLGPMLRFWFRSRAQESAFSNSPAMLMQVTQVLCAQKHCLTIWFSAPWIRKSRSSSLSSVVYLHGSLWKRNLDSTPQLLSQNQGRADSRGTVNVLPGVFWVTLKFDNHCCESSCQWLSSFIEFIGVTLVNKII